MPPRTLFKQDVVYAQNLLIISKILLSGTLCIFSFPFNCVAESFCCTECQYFYMPSSKQCCLLWYGKLFCVQIYVIHVLLGDGTAIPCVYALIEQKTQEKYERIMHEIERRASLLTPAALPDPHVVVVNFVSAAFAAVRQVFGSTVTVHGCFFHLTQSKWRKIQAVGLTDRYKSDKAFHILCGMLDGLAFLPVVDVVAGLAWLRSETPADAVPLVNYFDETYVTGSLRQVTVNGLTGMRATPSRFPPETWSVNDITLAGGHRTNNVSEGWNNRLRHLVVHLHLTVWLLVEALQTDTAEAATTLMRHAVGNLPPPTQSRSTHTLQECLCAEYDDGRRTSRTW